jgi:membrane-associated protein
MTELVDLVLHLDRHLVTLAAAYGPWIYALLFTIIFAETGLVVTPFLPGDSLLFAAGALSALGAIDPFFTALLLVVGAILGDAVNYYAGDTIGPRVFRATDHSTRLERMLNRDHLARAHAFFERYGGKAIVLGRFVPIVRTFVPFVAGAGTMRYRTFAFYNVTGALLWVGLCFGAGYLFGNVPIVKNNFSLVALAIIALSLLPIAYEFIKHKRMGAGATPAAPR